jgi:hypothetical protein
MQRETLKLFVLAERMDAWFFFLSPAELTVGIAGPEEAKNPAGKCTTPDSDQLATPSLAKISLTRQINSLK